MRRIAAIVIPRLACEIEYRDWTRDTLVRQSSFKGLREDKDANTVVREGPDQPEQ